MTFRGFSIGLVAALSLSLSPVWAQERSRPADSPTTGSAVPRGSDSGSSSSSSNSGSSGSNSGSGASSSPSSSGSWMDGSSHRVESPRAPVRPEQSNRAEAADQRRSNGATSGRAVPRNEGSAAGSPSSTSASSGSDGRSRDRSSTAVPAYSRPRDGRNATGQAVPRTGAVPGDDHFHGGYYPYYPGYIYDPYYSYYYDPFYSTRYGYWAPYGYGYGLGYFSYDPFLFGALGYPYYGGAYDPYFSGGGGTGGGSSSGASSSQVYPGSGSIRLKVKPRNAEVFIDGLSVGTVDSFDGTFQRLDVQAGPHKIELRAEGYQTEQFDVIVTNGETVPTRET